MMNNWLAKRAIGLLFAGCLPVGAEPVLTHAQIADRNKPGTVMIKTVWSSTIEVGEEQIAIDRLLKFVSKQVALGLVSTNVNATAKAAFDELLQHPLLYLLPAKTLRRLNDVKTVVSGSGFIVTPDGYLVTNAHVVHAGDDTLKEFIVSAWRYNQLGDVFQKDFANLKRLFAESPAVDQQALEDKLGDFVNAEKDFYSHNMRIESTETQVYAALGVAIPGLHTLAKDIPCEIKKEGKETPGKDVAILKAEQNNLPTVAVGDDSALQVGDSIVVLGYPGAADMSFMPTQAGIEATLTQGDLSARKEMPGGWSALQTSAEINHGNSGGPAFNDRGEVIGLATFGSADPRVRGINFLVPMSVAREFLNELNIKPQQGRVSELYQQALGDMGRSCYKGALEKFKEISDISPGFPFLQEKVTRARNAIDQGLDRCWMPGANALYIGGGVTGLVALLAILWLITKKRTAPVLAPAGMSFPVGATVIQSKPELRPSLSAATVVQPQGLGFLQCTTGSAAGKRFPVLKAGLLIGRDPAKCQIVLSYDAVSKEHAWIGPLEGGTLVIDKGSSNGTYLNSLASPRITRAHLKPGDRIYIGKDLAAFIYLSS